MMNRQHLPSSYGSRNNAVLDSTLREILTVITPREKDRVERYHVVNFVRALVESEESLRGATVEAFGSFVSNLYTKWGDLDISLDVPNGERRMEEVLGHIHKALRARACLCQELISSKLDKVIPQSEGIGIIGSSVKFTQCGSVFSNSGRASQFIPSQRLPLVKFQSHYEDISCDVSVCNLPGQIKSKIMLRIAEIDERFREMVLLIKEWAKAQNINDASTGTLNSYSLCLLVIFLFQTCSPPILPPLKDIYEGNIANNLTGMRSTVEKTCAANIARFRSRRQVNRSSLSDLLILFFEKFSGNDIFSVDSAFSICTFTGRWERIPNQKTCKILIVDPFERNENAARAVGPYQLTRTSKAIQRTYRTLTSSSPSSSSASDRNSIISILVQPHHHCHFRHQQNYMRVHDQQNYMRVENNGATSSSSTILETPAQNHRVRGLERGGPSMVSAEKKKGSVAADSLKSKASPGWAAAMGIGAVAGTALAAWELYSLLSKPSDPPSDEDYVRNLFLIGL